METIRLGIIMNGRITKRRGRRIADAMHAR